MITFTGMSPLITDAAIPALTEATMYCSFNVTDTTGPYTVWRMGSISLPEYYLMIEDGKLKFRTIYNLLGGGTEGIWTCSISANTRYYCGLKYNFNGVEANDPTIYLNGTKQTLTEESTPDSASAHGSDKITVGGTVNHIEGFIDWQSEEFAGRIGDLYLATRLHTDAEMERHTFSRLKGFSYYHQKASGILYCPMDDISSGSNISASSATLLPNGDVTSLWTNKTQSTYWDSVNSDGADYIEATSADDSEAQTFNMTTFTKSATISSVELNVKGNTDDDAQLSCSLYKGSSWLTNWSTNFTGSTSTETFTYYGDWSQAELDGMQLRLTTPTMDKGDSITVYYVNVKVYYGKCKDRFGSYNLVGKNATGYGEDMLTYI